MWKYCLPAIVLLLFVAAWPLGRTLYLSLTDATLGRMEATHFIGLENYIYLFADSYWWRSVLNTFVFVIFSVSLETVLGLIVALVLNSKFPGRGFLRAAILVPWAIPTVVSAKMWAWMFNDMYGVINASLKGLGWIDSPVAWLAQPQLALVTVVIVDVWKATPFMALLILAGLQSLPSSIYEVARIEGVSPLKRFLHITLPLIRPAIAVAVIFRTLDALRVFDLPYVLTSNSRSTAVMSVYARQQLIDFQETGYGSAASFAIFFLIALITVFYLYANRFSLGLAK